MNKNKLEEHQEKIEDHEHRITVLEEHSNYFFKSLSIVKIILLESFLEFNEGNYTPKT